ncbi:MAG: hypothetical protein ACI9U2_004581 [Bradymonadia bacterium]|jgi:hypothetical protein
MGNCRARVGRGGGRQRGLGKLHWFHPRYEEPFSKPQSLATGVGVTDQPLRPVRMQLPPGPMEICAMFTKEQMDVSVIDGWFIVAEAWWPHGRRACLEISVKPANNSSRQIRFQQP